MEEQPLIQEITLPLYQARGWMRFLAVMFMLQGGAMILTVVGIIICWIPIWLGVLLLKAASLTETAYISGDKMQLVGSLGRIKTFFIINGVLLLAMLVLGGLMALFGAASFFSLMDSR